VVTQVKTTQSDGYNAIQVAFADIPERLVNKPIKGIFKKAKAPLKRFIRELRVDNAAEFTLGAEIKADVFKEGDKIDVVGTSKGKGFQGAIKRHGLSRGPMKHGSKYHRHAGSNGPATTPGRVFPGKHMPGHMGHVRVTVQNLTVVRVDADKNLLLVKGAVPGPRRSLVLVKDTVKHVK
jgi:large subunit ribosomal protein L3